MSNGKIKAECNKTELCAIAQWFKGAHASNWPTDDDKAIWSFGRETDGKLIASLFGGYAI